MARDLASAVSILDDVLARLDQPEGPYQQELSAVHPSHRGGARNLVDYLQLRGEKVVELQRQLATWGIPLLQFPEAKVRAQVALARTVVAALAGGDEPSSAAGDAAAASSPAELMDAIMTSRQRLWDHSTELLGPTPDNRSTRIMASLPRSAATDPEAVKMLVSSGAQLVRINTVRDDATVWEGLAQQVAAAAEATDTPVRVAVDLAGPKVLAGPVAAGPRVGAVLVERYEDGELRYPSRMWLVPDDVPGEKMPEPPQQEGHPPLTVRVEREWFSLLTEGSKVRTADKRGVQRTFTLVMLEDNGALVEGERSVWIRNHSMLESNFERTRVTGIPPLEQYIHVEVGDELRLTADLTPVDPPRNGEIAQLGCTEPAIFEKLAPGDPVLFADGMVHAVVEELGNGEASLRITHTTDGGSNLTSYCGINLPATPLPEDAVTEMDKQVLDIVMPFADIIEISFVRTAEDMRRAVTTVQKAAAKAGRDVGIVLKIETLEAMQNLPELMLELMHHDKVGVMVARGDLAAELGLIEMVTAPSYVVDMCEAAQIPVTFASGVLQSLTQKGVATRAEVTDAAWAQRAECVMVDRGPHMVEAVQALNVVLEDMDAVQYERMPLLPLHNSWQS